MLNSHFLFFSGSGFGVGVINGFAGTRTGEGYGAGFDSGGSGFGGGSGYTDGSGRGSGSDFESKVIDEIFDFRSLVLRTLVLRTFLAAEEEE